METWLFLALILLIALIGKNTSLVVATIAVAIIKAIPFTQKWLPIIQSKGIN